MEASPPGDAGGASSSGGNSTWTMYLAPSATYSDDDDGGGSDIDVVDNDGGDSMASDACSGPFPRCGANYVDDVDEDDEEEPEDDGNVDHGAPIGGGYAQKRGCGIKDDGDDAGNCEEDGGGESLEQDGDDYS